MDIMRGSRCPEKFTLQTGRDSINGAIIEYRRGVAPFNTRRIHGHHVPQVTSIVAAGWLGSVKLLYLSFQRIRNQMILVPELRCAWIGEPPQCWPGGTIPVGGKHRLPYDKNANWGRRRLLQSFFDCRGPLQTLWSRRRDQQHDPRGCSRRVKTSLEFRNVCWVQGYQRRLAGRSVARSPQIKCDRQKQNRDDQPERSFSIHCLTCDPVCHELWEDCHKKDNDHREPEQCHADAAAPGIAPIAPVIQLPTTEGEQQNRGAEKPWAERRKPYADAREAKSANDPQGQTTSQSG